MEQPRWFTKLSPVAVVLAALGCVGTAYAYYSFAHAQREPGGYTPLWVCMLAVAGLVGSGHFSRASASSHRVVGSLAWAAGSALVSGLVLIAALVWSFGS